MLSVTRIFCILTLLPSWAASSFGMLGRCGLLTHHGWRQTRPGRSPPFGNLVEWRYKFKVSGTTPYKHIMSLGEYTLSSPRRCSKRALLLMFQCHLFSGRGIPKVPYLAVSVFSLGVEYSILKNLYDEISALSSFTGRMLQKPKSGLTSFLCLSSTLNPGCILLSIYEKQLTPGDPNKPCKSSFKPRQTSDDRLYTCNQASIFVPNDNAIDRLHMIPLTMHKVIEFWKHG